MVLQRQEEKCPATPGPESGSSGLFSEPANLKASQECGEEREGVSGGSHPGRPLCLHLGTLGHFPELLSAPLVRLLRALGMPGPVWRISSFIITGAL